MRKTNLSLSTGGFSVIELLIVLVIVGILVTFAVLSFGTSASNLERQNVAREFKTSLERARFDSVKRRASECSDMSNVTISSPTLFSYSIDRDQNGRLDLPVETTVVDFTNRSDLMVIGNGVTLPVTIRFDERGRAFLRNDCDPSSIPTASVPLFYFCNGACTVSTVNAENANSIFISATGTVAMMTGDATIPTFDPPTVTTYPAANGVDEDLIIWTGTPPTPTPFPPFTSPTPTPMPSATPDTTIPPTPTPTPIRACNYNEKPHGNPPTCVCYQPMYLGNGGKCVGPTSTPTPTPTP